MDQSLIFDTAALVMRSMKVKTLMLASFDTYLEGEIPQLGVSPSL